MFLISKNVCVYNILLTNILAVKNFQSIQSMNSKEKFLSICT